MLGTYALTVRGRSFFIRRFALEVVEGVVCVRATPGAVPNGTNASTEALVHDLARANGEGRCGDGWTRARRRRGLRRRRHGDRDPGSPRPRAAASPRGRRARRCGAPARLSIRSSSRAELINIYLATGQLERAQKHAVDGLAELPADVALPRLLLTRYLATGKLSVEDAKRDLAIVESDGRFRDEVALERAWLRSVRAR